MPTVQRTSLANDDLVAMLPRHLDKAGIFYHSTAETPLDSLPGRVGPIDLVFEATTATLRRLWNDWMCRKGDGAFVDVRFLDRRVGGVPAPAVDAYRALEQALRSAGYTPKSCWAYNCRLIEGTDKLSLHSAGIAVDIDPKQNPYTEGDPFNGKIQPDHVAAVMAIRNLAGARVWSWGGHWTKPDRMHFQLDQGPGDVEVDWATVPGGRSEGAGALESEPMNAKEDEMVLARGMENAAVKRFQECLLTWNPKALPKHGAEETSEPRRSTGLVGSRSRSGWSRPAKSTG